MYRLSVLVIRVVALPVMPPELTMTGMADYHPSMETERIPTGTDKSKIVPWRWGKRFTIPIVGTLSIVALIMFKVDSAKLADYARPQNLSMVVQATALAAAFIIGVGTMKLMVLTRAVGVTLNFRQALFIILSGNPVRLALPFKAGEIVKALYLDRRFGLAWEQGLGLMVLDKVFNVTATAIYLGFGILVYGTGWSALILCLLFVGPLFSLSFDPIRKRLPLSTLAGKGRIGSKLANFIHPFTLISMRTKAVLILLSLIMATGYLIGAQMLFSAYAIDVSLGSVLALIPITILVTGLPITFAGIGAREASVMILFSRWATPEQLLCVGAAITIFLNALPELLGLCLTPILLQRTFTNDCSLQLEQPAPGEQHLDA